MGNGKGEKIEAQGTRKRLEDRVRGVEGSRFQGEKIKRKEKNNSEA